MARVMMIGYGPLPQPGLTRMAASALRTRQFLMPLLETGHTVFLYTLPLPGTEGPEGEVATIAPAQFEGLTYQRFTRHDGAFALRVLTEQVRQIHPDAIVGVTTYPAYLAAGLPFAIPVWGDLCGSWMAQQQGRCWLEQTDEPLADAWTIERAIVRRVDRFSTVSRPHLHMVLGEMASVGRLNRHTFQYQFGHRIPHACFRWPSEAEGESDPPPPVLRGPIVPAEAFVILWSGGFYLWCDVATLVEAMNRLMDRYPTVHLVSTGGRVEGHPARTYEQFQAAIEASPHKDRFHDLGWVSSEQLPRIYREADLGVYVDGRNYETMFGGRARLVGMAAEGLALAATVGAEVCEWLADGRALLAAPLGDPAALVEAIEPWIEQPEHLREMGRRARRLVESDFSPARTMRPLVEWLEQPELAPDNRARVEMSQGRASDLSQVPLNALDEAALGLARAPIRDLLEAYDQLQTLRRSPLRSRLLGVK